ncbi:MAG TPA: PIG-L family deacetylase [Anaerolineae bacterium]|nr:PIG-L family deacetylase [Anaerolineae bacterium]HOQ98142.1 PIG-L family deacetylase [Anaerolineae bacterium]
MNKVVLGIFPHADDAASSCGGTLARFAAEGWRVILARVTNDDKDSMDLPSKAETELANTIEFHRAAEIMGAEIVELGYVTDVLGDVNMVGLRERIVYLFRKYRPYAVFTFDPYAHYEPNLDHVRTAQAVEEAFWVSNFHLHYPEHLGQGYQPHCVCERWYFGRVLPDANYAVDITDYFEQKVRALCAHDKMMRNTLHQLQLQLRTWGRRVPAIDQAIEGDLRPMVEGLLRAHNGELAQSFGMAPGHLAEAFRVNRFGFWEEFVQAESEPLPGKPEEMFNRSCFEPGKGPRLFN